MLDKIMDFLHFAYRQKAAVYTVGVNLAKIFKDFSLRRVGAFFMALAGMFSSLIFDGAVPPTGDPLNLDGYTEVFCDEFDSDSLDLDVWAHRGVGARRCGYNAESQAYVENGNLIIKAEYLENGEFGEGWYTGMVKLRQQYQGGYFEIKCKCNDGGDFWSAFWIQAAHPYEADISKGGVGGAEIDIFEAMSANKKLPFNRNAVTSTVHCNGVDDDDDHIDSRNIGTFMGKNIYTDYNTYGVEWTDEEYIFYVNGIETGRTSFGLGTSKVPEDVIVSLEIPDEVKKDKSFSTEFVVDYVKIYQK
ncbi:MAG: glycoside hydrolase family 16 protein [Clostridiales bacterium]|nr:glycoside hydrolase family 16 protein [Clostridiales bacterium]